MADDAQTVLGIMGDEVTLKPGLRLTVILPAVANLTLFKDGRPVDRITASHWRIPVESPGVYRVEAMRFGKPWIITNPIYVRPEATRVDSP